MPSFKRNDLGKDAAGNDGGSRPAAPSGLSPLDAIENRFTWYWAFRPRLPAAMKRPLLPHSVVPRGNGVTP